jgi:uncharacterized membrane protein
MPKLNNSVNISAPVERVFAYVSDPTNLPEWMGSLSEVTDVTGSGVGQHYNWKYNMVGIPLRGDSRIIDLVPNERLATESKSGVENTFTFTPHGSGTKLDLEVDYNIPVPVLGKLAEQLVLKRNRREAEMWVENLKERLEASQA